MPLKLIRADITKTECDAIVNAANKTLLGGGGVDGAIHKAAGTKLLFECMKLGGCKTGDAKITTRYTLPCKYVIHTVGPRWNGGQNGEEELLRSCYRNSLALAKENGCESIAFPLISAGVYHYPKDQALKIAVDEITAFLLENDILAYIVVYDKSSFKISEKLFDNISSFIDDNYVESNFEINRESRRLDDCVSEYGLNTVDESLASDAICEPPYAPVSYSIRSVGKTVCAKEMSLNDMLDDIDESFSEMLLRKIDEKGMTDVECYKKANVDRKLFSKIRSNKQYKPSKATALAFCIALELSLGETQEMLMKAGYALSHSNKFDIIIEYFITHKNYNVIEINEALFAFDQVLLGA